MSGTKQEILADALSLPADDRADLAVTLLESLDEPTDAGVDEAWAVEIERRVREVDSGAVKTIPWPEARAQILALRNARKRACAPSRMLSSIDRWGTRSSSTLVRSGFTNGLGAVSALRHSSRAPS